MVGVTFPALPFTDGEILHVFVLVSAAGTQLAGWKVPGHCNNLLAVPARFVFQHGPELGPTGVADGFCQLMILDQVGNQQILDADDVVIFDDLGRYFLQVIGSGIVDLLVDSGDPGALLLVVFRFGQFAPILFGLLPPSGKHFLLLGKFPLEFAERSQVLVDGFIRKDGKILQADIDTANGTRLGQLLNLGFDQNGDEALARWVPPYGGVQDPPVHFLRLGKRDQPQFGQFQFVSHDGDVPVGQFGGVGLNGVPFALEARRAVLLFEKAIEGIAEIPQG